MSKTATITQQVPTYETIPFDSIKMKDLSNTVDNTMGTPPLSNTPQALYADPTYPDPNGYLKSPPAADTQSDSSTFRNDSYVYKFQQAVIQCCTQNSKWIVRCILLALLIGYTIYFGFVMSRTFDFNARILLIITCIVLFMIGYHYVKKFFGATIYKNILHPMEKGFNKIWPYAKWFVVPAIFIVILLYMVLDVVRDFRQLQSVSGLVFFILVLYIFSKYPNHVNWRPVVFGFILQFLMGVLVLRWKPGYDFIKFLSDQVSTFIGYANEGASGVFGDPFFLFHPFAFVGMPMLIYVGAVLSILYYFGLTQIVAAKVGWFMQFTMGTTAIESLSVAANIFLNGMDIMLMLRPYLQRLTRSEFHTFLVGNHSTVAGFAFAIFVMFGAPPQHLLTAAVMSAPAAIAVSKLSYPETEESTLKTQEDVILSRGDETNVIEAMANGASVAGKTAAAVIVNMIAFLGILGFVNATLSWLGGRLGYPQLSFQVICSYLFIPLSLMMGVEWSNVRTVSKLVGIKVFTSEIIAYQVLGEDIRAGRLTERSAAIATYALCGFSGLATTAIAVGVWNAVCPPKTKDMANQLLRVIINANISCFLTACVAGILYTSDLRGPEPTQNPDGNLIGDILDLIPGYRELFAMMPDN